MDEATAKTKWCPLVRGDNGRNMFQESRGAYKCIGSECMAWRWKIWPADKDSQFKVSIKTERGEIIPYQGDGEGCCGAFGKP